MGGKPRFPRGRVRPITGYLGQTRSHRLIAKLKQLGIGECTQPREYPPRRTPWICDNGAWSMREWSLARVLDHWRTDERTAFYRRVVSDAVELPTIVILPDIVAGGYESLALSLQWLEWMTENTPQLAERAYLAVQDGMNVNDIEPHIRRVSGIFVGGSTEWKWQTARSWAHLAHGVGKRLHIGRAGTKRLVLKARDAEADSIDSCVPLMSRDNLRRWLSALKV